MVMSGIAVAQEVDLVQLQLVVLGRIERDAVIDRERDVAVVEERDQIVHVLAATSRRSTRSPASRLGDLLDQHQSFRSELAILMISMPSSSHRSTDFSSNGVAMRMQLPGGSLHQRRRCPPDSRVSIVFLM